jgi:hypothetical protein
VYFESENDRDFAERASGALQQLVGTIAPNVVLLEILTLKANLIRRHSFSWEGGERNVPYHPPSQLGRQTLLITSEDIQAQGWGWPGSCVVSKRELDIKAASGGNPADILIHEWLHSIEGQIINGRPVPFVDDDEQMGLMGFTGSVGTDGEPTWHDWYRYVLGG